MVFTQINNQQSVVGVIMALKYMVIYRLANVSIINIQLLFVIYCRNEVQRLKGIEGMVYEPEELDRQVIYTLGNQCTYV